MKGQSNTLTVTVLLDSRSGTQTAFINELPGLVVQGTDDDDVKAKMDSLLNTYIKRLQSVKSNLDINRSCIA